MKTENRYRESGKNAKEFKICSVGIALIWTVLCLNSCSSTTSDQCLVDWDSLPNLISEYHDVSQEKISARYPINLYLDLSFGLKVAFNKDSSKQFFEEFINSFDFTRLQIQELKNDKISRLSCESNTRLFEILTQNKTYSNKYAPIDMALSEAVRDTNQISILVTDGELVKKDGKELNYAWAKDEFSFWLNENNTVAIYSTDHLDQGKGKHLYYILLIPGTDLELISKIDYQVNIPKLKGSFVKHVFNKKIFRVKTKYQGKQGGVCDEVGLNTNTFFTSDHFEYQDYTLKWGSFYEMLQQSFDPTTGESIPGGKHLFRNLFIEPVKHPMYKVKDLKIRITDLTENIESFYCCESCRTHPPQTVVDASGNQVLDPEFDPTYSYCYDESGRLKELYHYKRPINPAEFYDFLMFDTTLFNSTLLNGGIGEIGFKFHHNAVQSEYNLLGGTRLLRVELYLGETTKTDPHELDEKLEVFKWPGRDIEENTSLYNSIKVALQNSDPKGQKIYTYYIKNINRNEE